MIDIKQFLTQDEIERFDYSQEQKRIEREEEELSRMFMNRKQRRAYKAQQRKANK